MVLIWDLHSGARHTRARIQNNADPKWTCHVQITDLDLLRVAFEDAVLTQCDFYRILKCDAVRALSLLVHTCTYVLIVVFKSTAHAAIYAV